MNLKDITRLLKNLSSKGFVPTRRKGPTGIGHTLEQELNLKENNIAIPDLGGRVELKSTRRGSNTLVTLFTFNKGAWTIKAGKVITDYGYFDRDLQRQALYNVCKVNEVNSQGLTTTVDDTLQTINLIHKKSGVEIAHWSVYTIVGKFLNKLDKLIFVSADSKLIDGVEHFHFNQALLLTNPTPEKFLDSFKKGIVCIDIRMHLKANNIVRNHGTGFRVIESKLPSLYNNSKSLI